MSRQYRVLQTASSVVTYLLRGPNAENTGKCSESRTEKANSFIFEFWVAIELFQLILIQWNAYRHVFG